MPDATLAGFRAYFGTEFPEATYDDAAVSRALDEAADIYTLTARGQLYLAAHYLVLNAAAQQEIDDGAGAVTMERMGPRSVSYRSVARDADDAGYARTAYGRRFLELRRIAGAGPWSFR